VTLLDVQAPSVLNNGRMNSQPAESKRSFFLHRWWKQWLRRQMDSHGAFLRFPPYAAKSHELVTHTRDPVRFTTIALALDTILKSSIPGGLAEVGVFRGHLSRVLHQLAPERKLYLFDTFAGFPNQDLDAPDGRFKDTSLDRVKAAVGDLTNVFFRVGYFPETAAGLEDERFAFVMLDADKYKPTRAGLEFFYPRLSPGGYAMIHDYNSPESDYAVSKAVDQFLADKPEQLIAVADSGGSALFRKLGAARTRRSGS
jgi:O-methyltransferase